MGKSGFTKCLCPLGKPRQNNQRLFKSLFSGLTPLSESASRSPTYEKRIETMNRTQLKNYAPAARRDFIAAITNRARTLGITEQNIAEAQLQGDVLVIDGRPFSAALAPLRKKLVERIDREGFDQVMQSMAYIWFNRFVAIRYMELHGYLDHGYRVLSHPSSGENDQSTPELLQQAFHVASHTSMPGLNKEQIIDMQLDGNKDAELYRLLLIAQCNALNSAMPFLFERIDDETELLLPDNLLHSDSVIRQLVNSIDEDNWSEIEIIGWLYQFYISERKDEVMGKVVKSADIPAATQLFTPNWIVKYLVQNSIGAQWLATYPDSGLKERMDYYIEPAEQTEDVKQQLAAITPDTLNPEELTLIDPACGSGHILVEAYDLFKALYRERGYARHKIPKLILEKNLYGLDIDTRAAQMAGFALLMKARADSPRALSGALTLNIAALHDSYELDDEAIAHELFQAATQIESAVEGGEAFDHGQLFGGGQLTTQHSSGLTVNDIQALIRFFENGKTFGSLLTVSKELGGKLPQLQNLLEQVLDSGNALAKSHAQEVIDGFLKPAQLLAASYDAVVANPPYMGGKGMNAPLKKFAKDFYKDAKADLFACFIERGFTLAKPEGHNAMVTMQNWMFLSSYQAMRENLIEAKTIKNMAHLGARAFGTISGEVVQTAATVLVNSYTNQYKPVFLRLVDGNEEQKQKSFLSSKVRFEKNVQNDFKSIPGCPIAYWLSHSTIEAFEKSDSLSSQHRTAKGLVTLDNNRFLKLWHEVDFDHIGLSYCNSGDFLKSEAKWAPYNKGGGYRKWYGLCEYVINWVLNGQELKDFIVSKYGGGSYTKEIRNEDKYFEKSLTWSEVSTAGFSVRENGKGFVFDSTGPSIFDGNLTHTLAFCNSCIPEAFLQAMNATQHYVTANINALPVISKPEKITQAITNSAELLKKASKKDWDCFETSWDFQTNPLITSHSPQDTISESYKSYQSQNHQAITQMQQLEEENNRLFIDAYGLQDELTPEVPIEQITLTVNPPYRYAKGKTDAEYETLFRTDTLKELVSYAIGCMMGRYSLDAPGLIYAHSGGQDFAEVYQDKTNSLQPTAYRFSPDDDGIIPVSDTDWFADDACNRLVAFIETVWPREKRDENLRFLAEGLGMKSGEAPVESLRRYLSKDFFKDHLKTYKKRPIYWLFSSGKHKAFECLVYLHRYNEGTLSRMRVDYVQPLLGKYESRIKLLRDNIDAASSTSARKKMEKELTLRQNQQLELRKYDEQLRHYTDQRIALDLDDGVKVNYGKFGTLLAHVKDVTGKKP